MHNKVSLPATERNFYYLLYKICRAVIVTKHTPKSCVLSSSLVVLSEGDQDLGRDVSDCGVSLIVSNSSASRGVSGFTAASRLVSIVSRLDVDLDLHMLLCLCLLQLNMYQRTFITHAMLYNCVVMTTRASRAEHFADSSH